MFLFPTAASISQPTGDHTMRDAETCIRTLRADMKDLDREFRNDCANVIEQQAARVAELEQQIANMVANILENR
jgi:hypothetical protein